MSGSLPATFVKGFHNEELVWRMEYRNLGTTGLQVSSLALEIDSYRRLHDEEVITMLHEAIRSGINYIDTAPIYEFDQAQELLGRALKDVPRKAYYIATKVARCGMEPKRLFDYSAAKTRESVKKSLGLLGLDYVDVVLVDAIDNASSLDVVLNGTISVLEEFVKEGKVRYIGIAADNVNTLKKCVERAKDRVQLVLSYNHKLIENSCLKAFRKLEMGVIYGDYPYILLWLQAKKHNADEICKKHGVERDKLALYYSMQLNNADTLLVHISRCDLFKLSLHVLFAGLTSCEHEVLKYLLEQNN